MKREEPTLPRATPAQPMRPLTAAELERVKGSSGVGTGGTGVPIGSPGGGTNHS